MQRTNKALLKMARSIQSLQIKGKNDFGESGHTASTEPYFYDSAYQLVKRPHAIQIDENGKCIIAKQVKKVHGSNGSVPMNAKV